MRDIMPESVGHGKRRYVGSIDGVNKNGHFRHSPRFPDLLCERRLAERRLLSQSKWLQASERISPNSRGSFRQLSPPSLEW